MGLIKIGCCIVKDVGTTGSGKITISNAALWQVVLLLFSFDFLIELIFLSFSVAVVFFLLLFFLLLVAYSFLPLLMT